MLVSKIKPCMSKNKPLNGESANGSLNQLLFIWWYLATWITVVIIELIHASSPDSLFVEGVHLLDSKPSLIQMVSHNNFANRMAFCAVDASFKFLPYQLSMVGSWPTMAITGNGELGFDSGEGAWETATTSKDGSRRANYPIPTRGGSDDKKQRSASLVKCNLLLPRLVLEKT